MTILIVDDSMTSRMILDSILKSSGYGDIIMADSADRALAVLENFSRKPFGADIELILMDIVMPGMDGIEATSRIKSDDRFKDIPIIMVSVKDAVEGLEKGFEAGAIDYIGKPVSKVELRARIRSALRLKKEIDQRKLREKENERLIADLREALSKVRMLSGLLPICTVCKKIRDDKGYWKQLESFIRDHSTVEFTHGYCPECAKKICEGLE